MMDQQAGGEKIEIEGRECHIESMFTDTGQANGLNDQRNLQTLKFASARHSESDFLANKSDSDDGLFVTDSSDDVINDVMSDFSPAKDRMEQTRKTIMESLVQSFVSITPNDQNSSCETKKTANELQSTNDENTSDVIDAVCGRTDIHTMQGVTRLRRMQSDSAFPDIQRNASDLMSVAASDEYVTVASASEEPTTVSFFSHSASTSQLHVVFKPVLYERSKSAITFQIDQRPEKYDCHAVCAQPAHDVITDHWLLNDDRPRKSSSDLHQASQEGSLDHETAKRTSEEKLEKRQENSDGTQQTPESETCDAICRPKQESKPQESTNIDKQIFKATKLPRFYRLRPEATMVSSRSESCMIPKGHPIAFENATVKRSRSSGSRFSRSPMARATSANERLNKKDAGGVSYAAKHSTSPKRAPPRRCGATRKVKPPVATPSFGPEKSVILCGPIKAAQRGSHPGYESAPDFEDHNNRKQMERTKPRINICVTPSSKPMFRGGIKDIARNNMAKSESKKFSGLAPGTPTTDGFQISQTARHGSPTKSAKFRSALPVRTVKSPMSHCTHTKNSDGAATPKRTAQSSSKIVLKRPTPLLRSRASSLPAPSDRAGTETTAVSVPPRPLDRSRSGTGAGRPESTMAAPTLMSLKVDVSVRAEDGSVHRYRDQGTPPGDGGTGDLFSGVEGFIRGLLEGPSAVGGGREETPTTANVSALSQSGGAPRAPSRGAAVSTAGRQQVLGTIPSPSALPRKSLEAGSESNKHDRSAIDVFAQKLQAEDSVLLLTSTGSMSSTGLWPQAARQLVYPSRTVPVVSVTGKRPQPTQPSSELCPVNERPVGERDDGEDEGSKLDPGNHYLSRLETELALSLPINNGPQDHITVSSGKSVPSAPPSTPVRVKSPSASPDGGRTPSPRSKIPVPVRMLSESTVRASRSPSPERHSFYHTACTTPVRPRSATPDSIRSAAGSSDSLHSLKRSPRDVVPHGFIELIPLRASPSASDKNTRGRSHSSSPRSARSSPRKHSPVGQLCGSPQHNRIADSCSLVDALSKTFVCSNKTADGGNIGIHQLPDGVIPRPRTIEPVPVGVKQTKDSCTVVEYITSPSRVRCEDTLSGTCAQVQHTSATPADNRAPMPMKRSTSGPFISQQDISVQRPVPRKRRNVSPVRPVTPHPQNEEPMASSKTSFCSMDSPMRGTSPLPCEELPVKPVDNTDGSPLYHQNLSEMKLVVIEAPLKKEVAEETTQQPNFTSLSPRTPSATKIIPPVSENGASSSPSSLSVSPHNTRSNSPTQQSNDQADDTRKPGKQERQMQQQLQHENMKKDDGIITSLERDMIETENTLMLMEETINVLERQNNSLVTNTMEISEKIFQGRSRSYDLKTAKLMLQKVRMELQNTTKKSEESRMHLLNANDKISEQQSTIFLLKEYLREECIKNVKIERELRQRSPDSGGTRHFQHLCQPPEVDQKDQTSSSAFAEHHLVREILEETETLLQEERKARKDAEENLANERSSKLQILNAAKKWRRQLEVGTNPVGLGVDSSTGDSKSVFSPGVSESDSPNLKSYLSIHTPVNSNESINIDPRKHKSDESILIGQKLDIESVSDSEYFAADLTDTRDSACQCEILDGSLDWKNKYVEINEINDMHLMQIDEIKHDRMELKNELQLAKIKLKEETKKKERFEQELKSLIERIHEMQRDVQLYQRQSKEQVDTIRQSDQERIENLEMEKLKLKDYYQQQMEAIVQEKVSEFQGKVAHLETIVRGQINSYTKSMQQKFREKLATASIQQREVISRLEAEHSKEVERLTAEYPQEIERLQQRLAECRQEIMDKKSRLEQRETQVGTVLRVVKLLIREGNAMKGDKKARNTVDIARKILRCMDLNLDDIASPRSRPSGCIGQELDRGCATKDGSCATFRSIPDSPRPVPASRTTQARSAPPVPPRRKTLSDAGGQAAILKLKESDESTCSQPFNVSSEVKKKISYTRFGDEVIRARSEEFLQNSMKTQTKQPSTMSDVSRWGESGSCMLVGPPPMAPPPTPLSVTTSIGTNTNELDLVSKGSAQNDVSAALNEVDGLARVKRVADKGTGSADSLIRDPSFLLLTNAFLTEDAAQMCQCKRLQRAIEEYGRFKMTAAHRKRLKEGPPGRERTRSSSETSVTRLASSYFETIECDGVFETRKLGSRTINVSCMANSEQRPSKTHQDGLGSAFKANSVPNQLLSKETRETLATKAIETGGKFANPFSMKPVPFRRTNGTSEKVTSKPPIQNVSAPLPSRSLAVTGSPSSPSRHEKTPAVSDATAPVRSELARSRSQQDATVAERATSPSRNAIGRGRNTSLALKRMPSLDKVDVLDSKESSEDSKFALPQPVHPLELRPRDNRASVQRKQLAAMRKNSPREKERHHSISPRERKLFTLRNQQHANKKITRTEVTRRTPSPTPASPQAFFATTATSNQTRSLVPAFKPQRDRSHSGRRSASASMDWKKYIKSGQPWQDVYLHEHNDPDYVEPIPTNGTYYTAGTRGDDTDRSDWSPSYSWAPPRPGERDKWNRYLTTGQAAEQIALERFYATPERESADARRRMRRSRKQAEVLEYINRLMTASSGSDPSEEREGRRAERGARRARSHQRRVSDPAWRTSAEHQHGRSSVLDGVRRKALGQTDARHTADQLADASDRRPSFDQSGSRLQQQRVSHSLDRELPVPRRDCGVHQRLSAEVKTHQRLAREHSKQRRHSSAQERSSSQQRWPSDQRRKVPLTLVSRAPRGDLVPPEHRHHLSHSRSQYGTAASALDDLNMDLWVDRWERKWDHERKQRPLTHWPAT